MPTYIKSLIVVLVIAFLVFRLCKPFALRFTSEQNFDRRRSVWFFLTIVAFLAPNFWIYLSLGAPAILFATKKDDNPVALYALLLQVIPTIPVPIPTAIINDLFSLENYRVLSFCILIPTALRLRQQKEGRDDRRLTAVDGILLAYGLLQVLDTPPNTSFTATLRNAFLFYLDVFALYYAVSRSCQSREKLVEALASMCQACLLMAAIAMFEASRNWLLYSDVISRLSVGQFGNSYLFRGGVLRAQASAGHSLALGNMLAVALGLWLYLRSRLPTAISRLVGTTTFLLGLVSAYSRGPWLGALSVYFVFTALGKKALTKIVRSAAILAACALGILISPYGERFIRVLPFMGGAVDAGGVEYRERLAERSWELFLAHPIFGDPLVLDNMQDLRQGEGIIDFVNGYAYIGLYFGGVGLVLFVSFVLIPLMRAYRVSRNNQDSDPDLALLGIALIASVLGEMLMIGTSGLGTGPEKMLYFEIGLASAYVISAKHPKAQLLPLPAFPRLSG